MKNLENTKPLIRVAGYSDIEGLLNLGKIFHEYAELGKWGLGYSREGFAQVLAKCMNNPALRVFVAEIDGVVAGSIAGTISPWFLDPNQLNAAEQWWIVDPKYRGGPLAFDLLAALEAWAVQMGAKVMCVAGFSEKRIGALGRLYRRKGYLGLETHFVKEL